MSLIKCLTCLIAIILVALPSGTVAQTPSASALDHVNRGYERYVKADLDGAISDFTKAIELDTAALSSNPDEIKPRLTYAYFTRGMVWHSKTDFDKALADFNETIKLDPKHAGAYAKRGMVRLALWDDAAADQDFKTARGLDARVKTEIEEYTNRGYWIRCISSSPARDTSLVEGQHVKLTVTVAYRLSATDSALISLVLQRPDNSRLVPGRRQVEKQVSRGSGEVTLTDEFDVPVGIDFIRLFVPIMPDGYPSAIGEVLIEYPIKRQ